MLLFFRRLVPYLLILGLFSAITEAVTSALVKSLGHATPSGTFGYGSLIVLSFAVTCLGVFLVLLMVSYLPFGAGRRHSGNSGHFEAKSLMKVLSRDGDLRLEHLKEEPETLRNLDRLERGRW